MILHLINLLSLIAVSCNCNCNRSCIVIGIHILLFQLCAAAQLSIDNAIKGNILICSYVRSWLQVCCFELFSFLLTKLTSTV